ncbi:MAG: hypothetical protein WKF29_02145 [Thermoleophilaceae bacterium]
MKRIISKRPSAALVISCTSLFVALGGVSYGVATNSIDSREIKNGSIRNVDFKKGTLRGNEAKKDGFGGGAIKESTLGKIPASSVRWALVREDGSIEEQSGGFTVLSKPGINNQPAANPNIYINSGASLVGKGLSVSTAIQNLVDRGGNNGAMPDPAFKGDVSVGRCASPSINCVPAGTNLDTVLLVRSLADNSDGNSQSRRFYVEVTE